MHTFWNRRALAREVGVSPESVLRYETKGIVTPMRDRAGRRLYSDADVEKIRTYRAALAARAGSRPTR